jgi:hypothetical protein
MSENDLLNTNSRSGLKSAKESAAFDQGYRYGFNAGVRSVATQKSGAWIEWSLAATCLIVGYVVGYLLHATGV